MLKGENRVWGFFGAFPRALSPALGKVPPKNRTAVYFGFHCSVLGISLQ